MIKEILLEAAMLIELRKIDWMCDAIKTASFADFIPEEISKCGFTKSNYEEFIKKNFPELLRLLFKDLSHSYGCPWIDTMTPSTRDLVLQSKVEFLRSLANGN